jgi:hypothetical protein
MKCPQGRTLDPEVAILVKYYNDYSNELSMLCMRDNLKHFRLVLVQNSSLSSID